MYFTGITAVLLTAALFRDPGAVPVQPDNYATKFADTFSYKDEYDEDNHLIRRRFYIQTESDSWAEYTIYYSLPESSNKPGPVKYCEIVHYRGLMYSMYILNVLEHGYK